MKKENFVTLLMGTAGGILFGLGMCMCLVTEWGAFAQGIVVGGIGLAVLLAMLFIRRRMQGRPAIHFRAKTVGAVALAVVGVLTLGAGMCMTMVWEGMLIPGIAVGIVGIGLLLCLIPLCKGLR